MIASGKQEHRRCAESHPKHINLTEAELAVFRTRVCEQHRQGTCLNSDRCSHSHCQTWQRRNPADYSYSSKLCPEIEFVKRGNKMTLVRRCGRGRGCMFAHSKEEELYHPSVYKTKMCNAHPACSRCYCPFAHSSEELRYPTSPQLPLTYTPSATTTARVSGFIPYFPCNRSNVVDAAYKMVPQEVQQKSIVPCPASPMSASTCASTAPSPIMAALSPTSASPGLPLVNVLRSHVPPGSTKTGEAAHSMWPNFPRDTNNGDTPSYAAQVGHIDSFAASPTANGAAAALAAAAAACQQHTPEDCDLSAIKDSVLNNLLLQPSSLSSQSSEKLRQSSVFPCDDVSGMLKGSSIFGGDNNCHNNLNGGSSNTSELDSRGAITEDEARLYSELLMSVLKRDSELRNNTDIMHNNFLQQKSMKGDSPSSASPGIRCTAAKNSAVQQREQPLIMSLSSSESSPRQVYERQWSSKMSCSTNTGGASLLCEGSQDTRADHSTVVSDLGGFSSEATSPRGYLLEMANSGMVNNDSGVGQHGVGFSAANYFSSAPTTFNQDGSTISACSGYVVPPPPPPPLPKQLWSGELETFLADAAASVNKMNDCCCFFGNGSGGNSGTGCMKCCSSPSSKSFSAGTSIGMGTTPQYPCDLYSKLLPPLPSWQQGAPSSISPSPMDEIYFSPHFNVNNSAALGMPNFGPPPPDNENAAAEGTALLLKALSLLNGTRENDTFFNEGNAGVEEGGGIRFDSNQQHQVKGYSDGGASQFLKIQPMKPTMAGEIFPRDMHHKNNSKTLQQQLYIEGGGDASVEQRNTGRSSNQSFYRTGPLLLPRLKQKQTAAATGDTPLSAAAEKEFNRLIVGQKQGAGGIMGTFDTTLAAAYPVDVAVNDVNSGQRYHRL